MPTQAERRAATRARLLDEAEKLFAARGYEDTPTEAVLDAAGVSRGALYHYFRGKQELFAAVFERVSTRAIGRALARSRRGGSPREALLAGCLAWLAEARKPEVAAILLDQGPQVLGWQRARELEARTSLALIRRGVRASVASGELQVDSVDLAARILNAVLAEIALLRASPKRAETALRQLLAGYSSPAPKPST